MYDELVKTLRDSNCATKGMCWRCPKRDKPCIYRFASEAADAIDELRNKLSLSDETGKALCHTAHKLLDEIPRWIPVTERLPKADGTFITAYSKGGVSQNWYMTFHHGGGKWYQNSEDTGEVTHWMPLPEPPKEEWA